MYTPVHTRQRLRLGESKRNSENIGNSSAGGLPRAWRTTTSSKTTMSINLVILPDGIGPSHNALWSRVTHLRGVLTIPYSALSHSQQGSLQNRFWNLRSYLDSCTSCSRARPYIELCMVPYGLVDVGDLVRRLRCFLMVMWHGFPTLLATGQPLQAWNASI